MRIGINGRFLLAKRTGVQRAAYNLLRAVFTLDRENEFFLFTGEQQVTNPDWRFPNVTVVPSALQENAMVRNHFWEQFILPRLCYEHRIDLLHCPANIAPLFYRGRVVINIHDLCFVVNPQWYSYQFRTLYNLVIPRLARRAARIITNSNNSRNDLLQYCSVPASKVNLVYWAVDDQFRNTNASVARNDGRDYILYVGSLEPRKNIALLVEAYEILRNRNPDLRPKLFLIGGESPLFGGVRLRIKRHVEDVVFKGFVDDESLRQYYRNARLFVYPSLYEGFGLPPLEAMASGTPVVTSRSSSLPEVVGDAAILVDPYDPEELASAMEGVLRSESLRRDLVDRGLEKVKEFDWFRVARATIAVYYEAYGDPEGLPYDRWRRLCEIGRQHQRLTESPAL